MGILEKLGITPGPWRHIAVNGGWDGVGSNNCIICNLQDNNPINADLIAAAPEMLEVLINRVRIEIESNKSNIPENMIEDIYADEIKIIEKATGKTWREIKELYEF